MISLTDGYPANINIEKQVLGLLAFSGRIVFCNMVFLTPDKGTAAKSCFANINTTETKIFALAYGLECPEEEYEIENIVKNKIYTDQKYVFNTHLAYIEVSNPAKFLAFILNHLNLIAL